MNEKKKSRLRRARKTRSKISSFGVNRLSVHRTPRHFYAQVTDPSGQQVLAAASTLHSTIRSKVSNTSNIEAAIVVGKLLATKAKDAGVKQVAFDRSGFKYHGRVKAFADAARENGLKF